MSRYPKPFDLKALKVHPLASRESMSQVEDILVEPANDPVPVGEVLQKSIRLCAEQIRSALKAGSGVMLIYGAHLIKNGGQLLLNRFLDHGWVTHLATNGAGIIHDWEFAFLGRSTESVRDNVATGSFGTWDETGRYIHLALLVGGISGEGFGRSLSRFVNQDGAVFPKVEELEASLRKEPSHPLAAARADLLRAMREHAIPSGPMMVLHRWRNACVLAHAFRQEVPLTVHPGIGYDIISNHPMFNGAVLGRAAEIDFKLFCASVETLDNGVVMSVGSAIMGPQVFEKSISCVNNVRLQTKRNIVQNHSIFVVDLQDGGNWDWTKGEPPKDNAAYYLRFCKSFSRMGGAMHYQQCDNVAFLHHLYHALQKSG
jgi:hypothetical protein